MIVHELSIVSGGLWTDNDSRLGEIFMMVPEKVFAGLSVVTVADLLQLPPVSGKLIFSQFSDKDSMKHLLSYIIRLWHLFKYAELTEVVQQNKLFINLFNNVRVGNLGDDVEKLLKARFIHESDENYPKDAVHMYEENEPAMNRNDTVLNVLPGELYVIETDYKIPDNSKYTTATIQAAQNKKQTKRRFSKVA